MCKKLSVWNTTLYTEAVALAEAFSAALLSLGVRRGNAAAIFYSSGITGEHEGVISYTQENHLLILTLKVRRRVFGQKYQKQIDGM